VIRNSDEDQRCAHLGYARAAAGAVAASWASEARSRATSSEVLYDISPVRRTPPFSVSPSASIAFGA
jgi:hypothetical protein